MYGTFNDAEPITQVRNYRAHTRAAMATAATAGLVLSALAVSAPAVAAPTEPTAIDATVFVEVETVGARVTTVAVEYDAKWNLKGADIDPSDFEVVATLAGAAGTTVGARTVTGAYISDEGRPGAPEKRTGNYLILELDVADLTAAYGYASGTRTYPLDGAYSVTQVGAIEGDKKNVTAPSAGGAVTNSSTRVLVVEDFVAGESTASNGISLDYKLHEPTVRRGAEAPLVLALHGSGGTGTDNLAPLINNELATAFADPERQADDPSFVLVPHRKPTQGSWSTPDMTAALLELVEDAKARLAVDEDRVYVTGNSMGGVGSWAVATASPDTFAAAVVVCGFGDDVEAARDAVAGLPIWAHHSVDDPSVEYYGNGSSHDIFTALEQSGTPVTWGEWRGDLSVTDAAAEAAALRAAAEAEGSIHLFTTYPAGTTQVSGHHSWIPTYSNPAVIDWMYDQVRQAD